MHCETPSGGPESERLGHKPKAARGILVALIGALVLVGTSVSAVSADAVYHTEQLELAPVAGAAGSGFVVNIHPNGPVVFASERYALRGAEPNASYTIWLIVDALALACDFDGLAIPMKADLQTNAVGNGTSPADFFFRPEGIPPCLRDASFPIHWEATLGGALTHITDVTMVTLD
jgi:hypothetical protein